MRKLKKNRCTFSIMGDDKSQVRSSLSNLGGVGKRAFQKIACTGYSHADDAQLWRGNAERTLCDIIETKAACDKLTIGCSWDNTDGLCLPTTGLTEEDFSALADKREAFFKKAICKSLPANDCPAPDCTVSDKGRCKAA